MKYTTHKIHQPRFSLIFKLVAMLLIIFSPLSLVQAAPGGVSGNLQLWLEANVGTSTTTDGDAIDTWNDQSGMAHHGSSTGAARPIFKNATTDLINFNPVIRFDDTDDEILVGDPLGIIGINAFTVFSIQKTSDPNGSTILGPDTTSHIPGPYYQSTINNVMHNIHAGTAFIDGGTVTVNDGIPHLSVTQRIGNDFYLYHAGVIEAEPTTNPLSFSGANKAIGSAYSASSQYLGGDIAEVIVYNTDLSDSDRQKVDTYLALKYGITLDNTIDYLASDGTTIYPSTGTHSGYTNDIAGIGTDNGSSLSQPKSRSVNSDSIITITGSSIVDGHFLIWGNDDGALSFSSTEVPGSGKRLAREWKIAETGDVGLVTLSFDLSSVTGANFSDVTKLTLLTDVDGNFSDATETTGATINGNTIEFSDINLSDGQYFSLAYNNVPVAGFGTALDFDGVDDYVDLDSHVTNFASLNQGTIAGWFKTSSTTVQTIFSISESSTNSNNVWIILGNSTSSYSDESITFALVRGNSQIFSMLVRKGHTFYQDGKWHHFAVVSGDSDNRIYIDGTRQTVTFKDGSANSNELLNINNADRMRIGNLNRQGNQNQLQFQGQIDEISIWNKAVSDAEVSTMVNAPLSGSEIGLLGYWRFEDNTGTTVADSSLNSNDGVLTGDMTWPFSTNKNLPISGFLANFVNFDADSDALTYTIIDNDEGTAAITNASTGAFTYAPTAPGTRTFTYQVKDGTEDSNIATVTVIVTSLVVDNTDDTDDGDYSPGQNTLREAITNASAGDTITFDSSIAEQTIKLDNQLTIDRDLTIDGTGQQITISGNDAVRVFEVIAGSTVTFESLTIADGNEIENTNTGGGILINSGATVTISNSSLSNNTAKVGGAIRNNGFLTIQNSTISGNIAPGAKQFGGRGGGIFAGGGTLTINNSTLASNQGQWRGGAFYNGNSTTTINNSTIAYNKAINGGGYYYDNGTISMQNTIIALNTGSAKNCHGTNTGTNNISNQGCSGVVFTGDPKLGSLQNNGGDTQTMALQAGSPAIDAGDNATCAELPGGNKDQRGAVRGTSCDIGAFEYNFPPVASSVNLSGTTTVEQTLTGSYNYSDVENDSEGISTFQWYSADDATCTTGKTPLSGATNTIYALTSSEAGKYVCFEVTPVANVGDITVGTAVLTTSSTTIKADQTINFGELNNQIYGIAPFTVSATATSGLSISFSASGSCTISGNTITLIEPGSCTITASQEGNSAYNAASNVSQSFNIAIPVYKLTVSKTGQGTIISENINCGKECQQYYNAGTDVTLVATPDEGWTLESWGGDCDNQGQVQINSETTCTATFIDTLPSVSEHVLTVTIIGKGSVIGAGIDCGTECKLIVPADEIRAVALTAKPNLEWILDSWSGDCDSQGYLQIDADKTCIATFIEDYNIPNDGDANGDGIPDSEQQNIVSIPDAIEGDYLSIQVEGEEATITNVYTDLAENLDGFDDSYVFPQGVLYFEIEGQEADVTIYYYGLQVAYHPVFQKFGPTIPGDLNTIGWYVLPDVTFDTVIINGQPVVTASYHLKDGELGDNTGVDGRIIDPGGISFSKDFDNVIGFLSKNENVSSKTGIATLTVSRSGTKGTVSVDYATANNTALAGQDYQTTSGTLTWAEGDREDKTISIPILNNATSGRTLKVTLTNLAVTGSPAKTGVLGISTATVNIVNNTIGFASNNQDLSIPADVANLIVNRSGIQGNVSVDYATVDDTAIAGQDYQTTHGTLNWATQENGAKTITIPLLDSALSDRSLKVILTNLTVKDPQTGQSVEDGVLDVDATTITLIQKEVESVISLTARGYSALKQDNLATITVNRSGTQGEASVVYSTIDGTAIAGQDYQATSGTLTWAHDESGAKTFTVTLLETANLGNSLIVNLSDVDSRQEIDIGTAVLTILAESPISEEDMTTPGTGTLTENDISVSDTLTDITTDSGTIISHVRLQGEINNQATLSDIIVDPNTKVSGGILAGKAISYGTLQDLTINSDALLEGGKLEGEMINHGTLSNVTTQKDAVVVGGILRGAIKNQGTLQDVTIEGSISGGNYAGTTFNKGLISNATNNEGAILIGGKMTGSSTNNGLMIDVTVTQYAKLSGGQFLGDITNDGTMTDVAILPGATITGGTLDGPINNQGTLQDVDLAKGVQIIGGTLSGTISGDPDNPAQIGAAEIAPGTKLSYVRLSPTVQLPENIQLGPGVILPTDLDNPTPEDFGLKTDKIAELDAKQLGHLEPAVFATFDEDMVAEIPPQAFAALSAEQMSEMKEEALESLTPEQFEAMPIEALQGLTSDNMGGLPTEVLNEFSPEHLNKLNVAEFHKMPSEDVSKLLTNLDAGSITPEDVAKLVPKDWQLDLKTGALTPPVGAKLTPPILSSPSQLPTHVALPTIPNLNAGIGVGGRGTSIKGGITRSLEEEDLTDFVLSQDDNGILVVEGIGDSEGVEYTFIPDADNAIQVDTDKTPIGLGVGQGGFYTITTPEGQQYKVIPAPKDPIALSEVIGGGEVSIGKRGDVMLEIPQQTRRGGARQVAIFEPFIEPAPPDLCTEIVPGEIFCDFGNALEFQQPGLHFDFPFRRGQRAISLIQAKVVYPDGTAQTIRPTLLSPDIFIEEGLQFEGVEKLVFNANGTFYVSYQGEPYLVKPNFEVKVKQEPKDELVEPDIIVNGNGTVTYTIAIDTQPEPQKQRRRGGAREVVIFEPFIEPLPPDLCTEIVPGEIFCDFDKALQFDQGLQNNF